MTVKVTIQDWDKVNHNNVVYEQSALDHMFYDSDVLEAPVLGPSADNDYSLSSSRDIVGTARVHRSDTFEVQADLDINDAASISSLIAENKGGFGACVVCADCTTVDGVHIVHSCKLRHIGYTLNPAQNTSFEIVKEKEYED